MRVGSGRIPIHPSRTSNCYDNRGRVSQDNRIRLTNLRPRTQRLAIGRLQNSVHKFGFAIRTGSLRAPQGDTKFVGTVRTKSPSGTSHESFESYRGLGCRLNRLKHIFRNSYSPSQPLLKFIGAELTISRSLFAWPEVVNTWIVVHRTLAHSLFLVSSHLPSRCVLDYSNFFLDCHSVHDILSFAVLRVCCI